MSFKITSASFKIENPAGVFVWIAQNWNFDLGIIEVFTAR